MACATSSCNARISRRSLRLKVFPHRTPPSMFPKPLSAVWMPSPLTHPFWRPYRRSLWRSAPTGRKAASSYPEGSPFNWGVQRLKNFLTSWRDQLLEVLGAMGLREVRRLRGEMGRAMFEKELEREAFSGIEGYGQ